MEQHHFWEDKEKMVVERDGEMAALPCERIKLDYPFLAGRAEACMGRMRDGDIYAAVAASCGTGGEGIKPTQRLFRSPDGGYTWSGGPIELPGEDSMIAFTALSNNSLLVAATDPGRSKIRCYLSSDAGETWQVISEILATPFDQIGEGVLSLTQLKDGTILFPICRWCKRPEGAPNRFPQYVFRSVDGGMSWQGGGELEEADVKPVGSGPASRWPGVGGTFPGCLETHVVELVDGRLLAAFRYSGFPQPWHRNRVEEWGGKPEGDGAGRLFKHVFLGDSHDRGRTWENLRPLFDAQGRGLLVFGECHGQLVTLPDERVVLVHDRRYPYDRGETIGRVSEDGGMTWSRDVYHLSAGSGYPASVALEDGTLITVVGNTRFDARSRPIEPWSVQVIRWRPKGGEGRENVTS